MDHNHSPKLMGGYPGGTYLEPRIYQVKCTVATLLTA